MTKRLNLVAAGFTRRVDLDFTDDGTTFRGYEYKGLPITYCKSKDYYFLSLRIDYLENNFTYDDWMKTDEYELCHEFNGVSEIDVDKLVENCEKVIAKRNELNEQVLNEVIITEPIIERIDKEIKMAKDVTENFKANFKWWKVNPDKLRCLGNYLNSELYEIKHLEETREALKSNMLEVRAVRQLQNKLNEYGYIRVRNEGNFYLDEMIQILSCQKEEKD